MINPAAMSVGSATATDSSSPKPMITDDASRDTFLRLLVAQIQNQDPLDPLNPTQFVSQLAQFSEMEQMLQVRQTLEDIRDLMQVQPETDTEPTPTEKNSQSKESK